MWIGAGQKNRYMEKETTRINPDVALELLQDMYFIAKLFQIQSYVGDDNKWLKDYYTKIGIPYLSIVLHECLQANLLDKEKSDKKVVKILKEIRQRIIKLSPKGASKSIKKISDAIGIDFDHYLFDLQIALNDKDNSLFDIGFTHYDLLDSVEKIEIFNSLIEISYHIIQGIIPLTPFNGNEAELAALSQRIYKEMGERVSKSISLQKYPYASGVFFKRPEICKEDRIVILYFYTPVKQAIMIDFLVPDYTDPGEIILDMMGAKCKFRAIVIASIGEFLKDATTPLAEELRVATNTAMESSFFPLNRAVKNNIHYNRTTVFEKDDLRKIYLQQERYLQIVLDIFDQKIQYNVGLKYKVIRFIADKTDSTMREVRKNNKRIRKWEDVPEKEWEEAKERTRKRNLK